MFEKTKISSEYLKEIAINCYDKLHSVSTRYEALQAVSDFISSEIGDFFGPGILIDHDEISVNFIELLDLIIFEIEENISSDDKISEYIIEELYNRLSIYLDIFKDKDLYSSNLHRRLITVDDALIIRQYHMEEYVPRLIKEYHEQPALQKFILWTLLHFNSDELLNFFYQIVKDEVCMEIKVMALVGLKMLGSKFTYWRLLASKDELCNNLIDYAKNFDTKNISNNKMPQNGITVLFALLFYEINLENFIDENNFDWIMQVLGIIPELKIDNSIVSSLYRSVSNIIFFMDLDSLITLCKKEDYLNVIVTLMDTMPKELFDRITIKISLLGDELQSMINDILISAKNGHKEKNSNLLLYLMLERQNAL